MKCLCLIVAGLLVVSALGIGCTSSHDRYRQMVYRRDLDADVLGIQDDVDATVLLSERPSHLSPWFANP